VSDQPERPVLHLLTSHWVSMLGVSLVSTAGFSWLFVLPMHIRGHADNPYIGLLVFVLIPIIFFLGLAMIPLGIFLAKRRVRDELGHVQDRKGAIRRLGLFFGVTTFVNLLIGSQITYRAVSHMESVQFCGQSCHVMQPEFTAHQLPPHEKVECVECHVVPGAAGFLRAKLAGTRQLAMVLTNSYPRPIPSAIESNRLAPSADTCEQCHDRDKNSGVKVRVIPKFSPDEANTASYTVLSMKIGGGAYGGIHGAHMGPGINIRYAAADSKRQTIPRVEYKNSISGVTSVYTAADAKADSAASLPTFEMECADCHNRAAHSFELAERAIDHGIDNGQVSASLPFVKKQALELLKADYSSGEEAAQKIPAAVAAFYQKQYPDVASKRSREIASSGNAIAAIYAHNVFPDLKVTWGTYPNNLGHTDFPGCFRCHDENHATPDKKTISQDCSLCHEAVAVEEASPAILTTLGISKPKL
jgi:NapC/NirT cytochrome c family, N-terminal region